MLSHLTNSPVERVGRVELRIIGLEGRWTPLVLSTRIEIGDLGATITLEIYFLKLMSAHIFVIVLRT